MNWIPTHQHSHFSLLDGFSKPEKMASRCKELGYTAAAITDHGSISGCIEFYKACKEEGIKALLGCELYVSSMPANIKTAENRGLNHAVIISKNKLGWEQLTECVSVSNLEENYYYHPRVDLGIMKTYLGHGNHICITGHPGTDLSQSLFTSNDVFEAKSKAEASTFLKEDWEASALRVIADYEAIFGENLFIEIQLIDKDNLPMSEVTAECLRAICLKNKRLKPIATADSHYVNKEDAILQRVLLCSNIGRTLTGIEKDIREGKDVPLKTFFISNNYHIPSLEEMQALHTDEELANALLVGELCEDYELLSAPRLPHYPCPDGKTDLDYLTELCRIGWKEKLVKEGKVANDQTKSIYTDRIKEELEVIAEANLSGYFLIVYDIINYCRTNGWLTGIGRGSAAGCLISYLLGITGIDPIPYNLLFSRFYNSSRKGSLPDIDLDIPSARRDQVIEYVKQKYGEENVSQMATFGCLMGKSALKEVLNICSNTSFAEQNDITDGIPDKAEIEDELEALGETSIIRWALTYRPKKFEQWVSLNDDGTLEGELAEYFNMAIALEGTPKSQGKHAGGVIISDSPLSKTCPIIRDKNGAKVAGFDMYGMELLGLVKFDILGLDFLDKIMEIAADKSLNINDFNDQATWDLIASGDTKGIFQIEKQAAWTKKLKPSSINHLAALMAIIRPGVAEAMLEGKSMTEHYIDRKNGAEEAKYMHESLRPILEETHGVIIYQESAMRIARDIAGFSLNEADILRKAMGKKNAALMAQVKNGFIEGCEKQQIVDSTTASSIFDWIEKAQRYLFNASHSYSYAINAYYSAFCKTHNLMKFYEVYLNRAFKDPDKLNEINELVNDAKNHGISILPPTLCNFHKNFTITKDDHDGRQIHFGVAHVKKVGDKEVDKLFAIVDSCERDICDLTWLEILMLFGKVKKDSFIALISVGAMNGANNKLSRTRMIYEYEIWKKLTAREIAFIANNLDPSQDLIYHINLLLNKFNLATNRTVKIISILDVLKDAPYDTEDNPIWVARAEKEYLGISMTCFSTDGLDSSCADTTCRDITSGNVRDKSSVVLAVELRSFREHKIKKNGPNKDKTMAFLSLEDISGRLNSAVVFPDVYMKSRDLLFEDNTLLVEGKVESRNDEKSLIVDRMYQI